MWARPITFVNSFGFGDPPSLDVFRRRVEMYPSVGFKLDAAPNWTPELIREIAATGVTDGALLKGVHFGPTVIETETVVYRSATGTVRRIHGEHRELAKFHLD